MLKTIPLHLIGTIVLFTNFIGALEDDDSSSEDLQPSSVAEIFHDGFTNGTFLNPAKWTVTNLDRLTYKELAYYRATNVYVQNGSLVLRVQHEPFGTASYTGARIETAGNFTFLYGEVEWRAKIVGAEGFWAGLWLAQKAQNNKMVDFRPPAASFMDYEGHTMLRAFQGPMEDDGQVYNTASSVYSNILLAGGMPEFHRYRLAWTKESLTWFIDDHRVFWVEDAKKVPQIPLQLVMNFAVGGQFGIHTPNTTAGTMPVVEMLIDYVSVWRTPDTISGKMEERRYSYGNTVPTYVGWTIGGLVGAILIVVGAGALFYYKFRQRDWVLPRDTRRGTLTSTASILEQD